MNRLGEIERNTLPIYEKPVSLVGYEINKADYDWLVEQAKTLQKITDTWIAIETNGTEKDAGNFYTTVQDILTEQLD